VNEKEYAYQRFNELLRLIQWGGIIYD
jgi:hypothetical protein